MIVCIYVVLCYCLFTMHKNRFVRLIDFNFMRIRETPYVDQQQHNTHHFILMTELRVECGLQIVGYCKDDFFFNGLKKKKNECFLVWDNCEMGLRWIFICGNYPHIVSSKPTCDWSNTNIYGGV